MSNVVSTQLPNEYDGDILDRIQKIYHSCTEAEQACLLEILNELADTGYSKTYENIWLADYKEIPVDIDTFLDDDMYLGKSTRQGTSVFPYWRDALREFFDPGNGKYEWILTGATRIGKSTTAVTAIAYQLYMIMCLRNPQQYFNLKDVSKISILFFNLTEKLAKGVMYREFNDTLNTSPWFKAHGTFSRSDRDFYYIPEGGLINIAYGSDAAHALGTQAIAVCMDECNFAQAGIKDIIKAKARVQEAYNILSTRVTGTFIKHGKVYGKVFAVSSKRSDSDFMEEYVTTQLEAGAGKHIYISSGAQWEILPPDRFSGKRFYIAVGNRYNKGYVIPDNQTTPEALAEIKAQGYTFMCPPEEVRSEFIANFDVALRDIAGVSIIGSMSFITQDLITSCVNANLNNLFNLEQFTIGVKDEQVLMDYFHPDEVSANDKRMPHYIHLDLSRTGDMSGITAIAINGHKDIIDDAGKKMQQHTYVHRFSVGLKAPRGDKVPFTKITSFIFSLRRMGFNIAGVSADQFQSEYIFELLQTQGIEADKISLDRTPEGYLTLQAIMMEGRIELLDHHLLQDELIHLQRDPITDKIDHTISSTKDISDSLAGAVWNAVKKNPPIPVSPVTVVNAIRAVNRFNPTQQNLPIPKEMAHMFPNITAIYQPTDKKRRR